LRLKFLLPKINLNILIFFSVARWYLKTLVFTEIWTWTKNSILQDTVLPIKLFRLLYFKKIFIILIKLFLIIFFLFIKSGRGPKLLKKESPYFLKLCLLGAPLIKNTNHRIIYFSPSYQKNFFTIVGLLDVRLANVSPWIKYSSYRTRTGNLGMKRPGNTDFTKEPNTFL
jgi:hypothetical protein